MSANIPLWQTPVYRTLTRISSCPGRVTGYLSSKTTGPPCFGTRAAVCVLGMDGSVILQGDVEREERSYAGMLGYWDATVHTQEVKPDGIYFEGQPS